MALSKDAFSASAPASGALSSWSHGGGTPDAVFVAIVSSSDDDQSPTVTYGGVSATEYSASPHRDSGGGLAEGGAVYWFELNSSVPSGTQTVVVSGLTTGLNIAYCWTVNGTSPEIFTHATILDPALTDPSTTLSLSSTTALVLEAFYSGVGNTGNMTQSSGWTGDDETDHGAACAGAYSYDTIAGSDVTVGLTMATDDIVLMAVGIKEGGGGATYTITTSLSAAIQKQQSVISVIDSAIQKAHTNAASVDAAIQWALEISANTDAAIQQSRDATAGTDAAVRKAFTISAALEAAIQKAQSATSSLDAYLVAAGMTAISASLDAYVQEATVALVQLDAAVQIGRSVSAGLDAYVSTGTTLTPDDLVAIDALIAARIDDIAIAVGARIVEGTLTSDTILRIILAAIAGKRIGIGTATEYYMAQDGITPRITFSPTDSNGNGIPSLDAS